MPQRANMFMVLYLSVIVASIPIASVTAGTSSSSKEVANILTTTSPGHWVEIPQSRLYDVVPAESFEQPIRYIVGPRAIMGAWNGAAFNSHLQRLDVFSSGGHGDYCGNEYFAFDLATLSWSLIHGPSDLTGFDIKRGQAINYVAPADLPARALKPGMGVAPDGKPISRHTYGGQVYHPGRRLYYMFGGSLCSAAGTPDDRWWSVTPNGNYELLGGIGAWTGLGWSAAYDSRSDNIFLTMAGNVYEYDVASNTRRPLTKFGSRQWGMSIAIDPTRNTLLALGHYNVEKPYTRPFRFDTATHDYESLEVDSDFAIAHLPGIGLEFVPELDRFVAWLNGSTLYLIDPTTFAMTAFETKGEPPPDSYNGVYGRFAYSVVYGGFIVATKVKANTYFLKLPAL